jgi:4a-hydroxytetrahydrobiopterin dehydratase
MPSASKLTEDEVRSALASLPGWSVVNGKLHREYKFADFVHAFGFMATSAIAIEAMNHHPEWFNVWNRVTVDLTTHDAGGISAKDLELAGKLEQLAQKLLG